MATARSATRGAPSRRCGDQRAPVQVASAPQGHTNQYSRTLASAMPALAPPDQCTTPWLLLNRSQDRPVRLRRVRFECRSQQRQVLSPVFGPSHYQSRGEGLRFAMILEEARTTTTVVN